MVGQETAERRAFEGEAHAAEGSSQKMGTWENQAKQQDREKGGPTEVSRYSMSWVRWTQAPSGTEGIVCEHLAVV